MNKFKELVESFTEVNYPKVTRGEHSYTQSREFIEEEISRLLEMYRSLTSVDQKARLIRDGIDMYLRRYHDYAIQGNIGSHYRQVGIDRLECDFEHIIPQSKIRDLLIQNKLSIRQAMNPPTCLIERRHHVTLKQEGWGSKTPSIWHFFDRYTLVFDEKFETFNGQPIEDLHNWTLEEHYKFFNIN